eukprot:jgi/Botrbrau1/15192/Bobra.0149s0055.5
MAAGWFLATTPRWTVFMTVGAIACAASVGTGLWLLLDSPLTYARYREVIVAAQWYIVPMFLLDKHPLLEAAKQQMSTSSFKGLCAALFFKWPPFLLCTYAFPVITAWAPLVQFISLMLLNMSALHAIANFGDDLVAGPLFSRACKRVDPTFKAHVSYIMRMRSRLMGQPPPSSTVLDGRCRQYLFGVWLLGLGIVYWFSFFRSAIRERQERRDYLQSLGIQASVTWPQLCVTVVQLFTIQAYLSGFLILFLDDISPGFLA